MSLPLKEPNLSSYSQNEYHFIPPLMSLRDIHLGVAHLDENCECCEMTAMTGRGCSPRLC